jgi:hypothetical protein
MNAQEKERRFLSLLGEYLVSLPSDLKVLQEAVADPNLDRRARELAAGTIVHTLLPQQEGEGPFRYVDDVLIVRAAFREVAEHGGEGVAQFRGRFPEVYDALDDTLAVFSGQLGDLWPWLSGKVDGFPRLVFKGRRAAQYLDDDEGPAALYEEGLEFETNYNVTEQQVQNRLRRIEQVTELLARKRADEIRRIA